MSVCPQSPPFPRIKISANFNITILHILSKHRTPILNKKTVLSFVKWIMLKTHSRRDLTGDKEIPKEGAKVFVNWGKNLKIGAFIFYPRIKTDASHTASTPGGFYQHLMLLPAHQDWAFTFTRASKLGPVDASTMTRRDFHNHRRLQDFLPPASERGLILRKLVHLTLHW